MKIKKAHQKRAQMTEEQLQQSIILYFNNKFCLKNMNPRGIIFSVPNESTYANKKFKNTGVLPGVSDLICITPKGKLMFIELKNEKGIQSQNQKEFEKRITELGYEYHLIRSLDEFKNKL